MLVLGLSAPASAQDKSPIYKVAKIAFWAGHGADLFTTAHCLGAKTCREVNPILRPLENHDYALGAVKLGLAAGQGYALDKLRERNPRLATVMTFVFAGVSFGIAARNARTAKR